MVAYRPTATARVAKDMPRTDITVTPDETLTGGRCLVGSEPVRHCMLWAQRAQRRAQAAWNARMAPALAQLNGPVMHSTRDEAPGLLASVAHQLEAHHAPAVCPVPHALSTAVWAPLAMHERAAHQAATAAQEPLEQVPAHRQTAGDEPEQRGPGRPPKAPVSLEPAQQALEAARRAHERRAPPRAQGATRIRGIGHDDHCVDLARGGRRNGHLMAAAIHAHMEPVRALAQHEGLRHSGLERMEKAARVVPNMPATRAFVSGDGRPQGDPLALTPPASFAMHAQRLPASDLDRVAQTRSVSAGEALRELAERRRTPRFAPRGALSQMSPAVQDQLQQRAKTLAEVCQRSRAKVEGRNGSWSRRNHQLRGLDLPRKRECLTAMHNFFLTRPDGTTAAERCFGQKPRSMCASILESVALPPAPLSPPRLP